MTSIYAFDLSLTATGWARYVSDKPITFGTLPEGKCTDLARLQFVRKQIDSMMWAPMPELVLVEGFSFNSRGAAVFQTGGLGYMIRDLLQSRDHKYIVCAPSQVKKFSTGKGNANKEIVIREVYKRWGHNVDDNNAADALALLYIGMALTGHWEPTTEAQRAVIVEVRKSHKWLEATA